MCELFGIGIFSFVSYKINIIVRARQRKKSKSETDGENITDIDSLPRKVRLLARVRCCEGLREVAPSR